MTVLIITTMSARSKQIIMSLFQQIDSNVYISNISKRISNIIWNDILEDTNIKKAILLRSNKQIPQGYELKVKGVNINSIDSLYFLTKNISKS